MFIDELTIRVTGGRGGDGCVSFRRERFIPRGGPNGGDGGDGGSIYCQVDGHRNTLRHLAGHRDWKAGAGVHGMGKDRHGRRGADKIILVPPGTVIIDEQRGVVLKDLTEPDQRVCVARGGRGGRGNAHFKSATNQAPRESEPGDVGEHRQLRLELKLIADVGLVGKPNAGKSTLLSRLSAARPKIAAYPFTTREPQLGIVELSGYRRLVMADIPGLIDGAHEGAGLGDAFLKHIERTRMLLHVVDICPDGGDPAVDYEAIRHELAAYSPALAAKTVLVAANKMDLTDSREAFESFAASLEVPVVAISGVTGRGLEGLIERLWSMLQEMDEASA